MKNVILEVINFVQFLYSLFPAPPNKKERKRRTEELVGRLVQRYSDNWRLTEGRYLTEEDCNKLKESALRCRF